VPIIDVEGYIGGDPVGGIKTRFAGGGESLPAAIALPIIFKQP